jgi:tRNA (uracil-5-)-methyltransferase TRM9
MDTTTAAQLIAINRRFYDEFGQAFSATRGRIQPGVRQILSRLKGNERILDLGCGNGQLARTLAEDGYHGTYLGLDFSLPLLKNAERQPEAFAVNFRVADLTAPTWDAALHPSTLRQAQVGPFDLIFAFAVLHHIPGYEQRRSILQKAHSLLAPGGKFIHSEWQFFNSEKLTERIQPWERAQLTDADVDPGDALLDWRSDGYGLRYVHHFSEQELLGLASESGFRVIESFLSDGANGRLGLYQIWERI